MKATITKENLTISSWLNPQRLIKWHKGTNLEHEHTMGWPEVIADFKILHQSQNSHERSVKRTGIVQVYRVYHKTISSRKTCTRPSCFDNTQKCSYFHSKETPPGKHTSKTWTLSELSKAIKNYLYWVFTGLDLKFQRPKGPIFEVLEGP